MAAATSTIWSRTATPSSPVHVPATRWCSRWPRPTARARRSTRGSWRMLRRLSRVLRTFASSLPLPRKNTLPMAIKTAHPGEYNSWQSMKKRCLNPRDRNYPQYGGRGIKIHPAWVSSFHQFLADMGPKPSPQHSIDRIDNDAGYEPANCRWATPQQQAANRRWCHRLKVNGIPLVASEAAPQVGVPYTTLVARLKNGLQPARAMQAGRLPARKDSKYLTLHTVTLSVPEWAKKLGIRVRTLRERLRRGDSLEHALREFKPESIVTSAKDRK